VSALEKLKAKLEQKAPDGELTKPTNSPFVSFVSKSPVPFSILKGSGSANDRHQLDIDALRSIWFDLAEADVEAGFSVSDIDRVNNLCWHIMEAERMAFADALRIAADMLVTCDPAPCERAYRDVCNLWRQILSKTGISPPVRAREGR